MFYLKWCYNIAHENKRQNNMFNFFKNIFLVLITILISNASFAQDNLNEIKLKNAKGKVVQMSDVMQSDKPVIISFWATWCSPCLRELDAVNEVYESWQEKLGVTLYAVCVDDARSKAKAVSLAKGKGWNYEILYDPNQDLKRVLNIINIPYTLVYHKGKLIYKHTGYSPGSEDVLFEKIQAAIL